MLGSDRQRVHWVVALEGDWTVRTFNLPGAAGTAPIDKAARLSDAVAERVDGAHEHQWVGGQDLSARSPQQAVVDNASPSAQSQQQAIGRR